VAFGWHWNRYEDRDIQPLQRVTLYPSHPFLIHHLILAVHLFSFLYPTLISIQTAHIAPCPYIKPIVNGKIYFCLYNICHLKTRYRISMYVWMVYSQSFSKPSCIMLDLLHSSESKVLPSLFRARVRRLFS